ncbi:heterokaryon incompatibility protein-domain-containing protein [Apiospora rasikravindrae]|uniref:Heterokaryon incompatibility protein-domain-containing protein n=1 Tax=Apiospora rasikravindrae TaxID=990691 RepID=A0ABR1RX54_9PEZI
MKITYSKPYRRLKGLRTIRLAVVEPGDWGSPISCYLSHSSLDDNPKYVALSYAWGSPRATRPILVDGIQLQVTVNLESALRHLRHQSEPLIIWIDAICINQLDLTERSEQVRLMRSIYQQASGVIVWLGDDVRHRIVGPSRYSKSPPRVTFYGDDRDDERVTSFAKRWSKPQPSAEYTAIDIFCFIRMLALQGHANHSLAQLHPSHLLGITEALRMMLLSQWWTRMWVFQEVIVASGVCFRYSGVEAPLDMFARAASCLQDPKYPRQLQPDAVAVLHHYSKTLSDIAHWRGLWREQQSQGHLGSASDLLGLLRATGMRKATDDRDRVFALLGLVDLEESLVPDYQQSPAQVFMSVCWASIRETRTLEALCGDLGRKNRSDLPSWTADWSAIVHDSDEVRIRLLEKYNACGDRKAETIRNTKELLTSIGSDVKNNGDLLWMPSWARNLFYGLRLWKTRWSRHLTLTLAAYNIYDFLFKLDLGTLVPPHNGCVQQGADLLYEDFSGGRLCAPTKAVGTVETVSLPIYEPIGPDDVAQTIEWIAATQDMLGSFKNARTKFWMHAPFARGLVFDMKYVDGQYHRLQNADLESLARWVDRFTQPPDDIGDLISGNTHRPKADADLGFDEVFKTLAVRRRMFRASNGNIGWGPLDTQPGDEIFILPGGRTPFVLRSATDQHGIEVFQLVGDCFLEGAMDGEWADVKEHTCPLRHSVLPAIFWSMTKYDLVEYANDSVIKAMKRTMVDSPKEMRDSRPILPYIDKPGVFEAWQAEVTQWASTYGYAHMLPPAVIGSNTIFCTAFRNLESMTKPPGHVVIV